MARISVGIPAYNEARYIEEAIRSVLAQRHAADEILVFDNASTDGTDVIAAQTLSPEAVHRLETNAGAAENFNRAVRDSTGEYFAWLAADDILLPDYLAETSAMLDANPELEAAFTFVEYFANDGRVLYYDRTRALNGSSAHRRIRSYLRRVRWGEFYSLYRREALLASPMYTPEYGGDVLLGWWFVLRNTMRVVEKPLLRKRVDDRDRSDSAMLTAIGGKEPSRRKGRPRATLWRALWRDAAREGVPRRATTIARRELLLALASRSWIQNLAADYVSVEFQGRMRRVIERLRGRPLEHSQ